MANRMFNIHAYVSCNLIFETTVHQQEERKKEKALQRKLSIENKTKEQNVVLFFSYFIDIK